MSEAGAGWIIDVGDADFQREVLDRSQERPVVVDFWAPWCAPCRMLAPILERLIQERKGDVVLARVNVDEAQAVAERFGISSIPAVHAFRGGQPVDGFVGLYPEAEIRRFLDSLVPTEADRLAAGAAEKEAADPAAAEARYRQALAGDPRHAPALLGLARVLLAKGQDDEARQTLRRVPPGQERGDVERLEAALWLRDRARPFGDEAAARQRLAADPGNARPRYELGLVLAAAGKYDEALAKLLSAAEADRELGRTEVREAMVKVFFAVGARSALADEYRDKLSRILY
jgi:putative thioredoxin